MVGALDNPEPEPYEPETHARDSQKPEWLSTEWLSTEWLYIRDELPRYRESSKPQ
jgi:hypothetical protein